MVIFSKSLPLLLAVALVGCGGSGLEVSEVKGVVTLDGKPLPNAVVTFSPVEPGPNAIGKTNEAGEYQLMTSRQLGAVPGKYKVSIICVPEPEPVKHVPSSDPSYQGGGGGVSSMNYSAPPVPEVPARYNAQTELTKEVESGAANTIDFKLKS